MAMLYFYVTGQHAHWVVQTSPDAQGTFFPTRTAAIGYAATAVRAMAAKGIEAGVRVKQPDGQWHDELAAAPLF